MLEVVKISCEYEWASLGCDCCTGTYEKYVLPDGSAYPTLVEALTGLLRNKGVVVEFE